jgi:SAM-dependent MidA family methyltransferase
VGAALETGYALLIDYGADDGGSGPLHGYQQHHVVDDVLADPGSTDITAGVDFGWIASHAEHVGLRAFDSVSQRDALLSLGFEPWYRNELDVQQRQLAGDEGLEAVRTWSGRSRSAMLVDSSALGRLRWLVLATPDLAAPPWLLAAQGRRTD